MSRWLFSVRSHMVLSVDTLGWSIWLTLASDQLRAVVVSANRQNCGWGVASCLCGAGLRLDHLQAVCMLYCCLHLQHYTKHEAGVAADTLSHTPEAAVSAVGTAAEVVSGVAGHMLDKVGWAVQQMPDIAFKQGPLYATCFVLQPGPAVAGHLVDKVAWGRMPEQPADIRLVRMIRTSVGILYFASVASAAAGQNCAAHSQAALVGADAALGPAVVSPPALGQGVRSQHHAAW
jgi:hypothetical protein